MTKMCSGKVVHRTLEKIVCVDGQHLLLISLQCIAFSCHEGFRSYICTFVSVLSFYFGINLWYVIVHNGNLLLYQVGTNPVHQVAMMRRKFVGALHVLAAW